MPLSRRQQTVMTILWALLVISAIVAIALWATIQRKPSANSNLPAPANGEPVVRVVDETPDEEAPGFAVPEFSFTNQQVQTVTLDRLKGNPWIADFIFTRCAGPCPVMTQKMASIQLRLPKEVRLVSFTVDPKYDSPAVLAEYAKRFKADDSRWDFLTGPKPELKAIFSALRIGVQEGQTPVDTIHSEHFVLIDADGKVAGYYNPNESGRLDALVQDARKLAPATPSAE